MTNGGGAVVAEEAGGQQRDVPSQLIVVQEHDAPGRTPKQARGYGARESVVAGRKDLETDKPVSPGNW